MPLVSVIIPTYRRSNLLGTAIRSVLNQTFQDFEIVVVDDNSQDDTEEVVRSFGGRKIRYIAHQTNLGCGGARNTGIRNSNSELVAFLDDDDEWLPDKLEEQISVLDHSGALTGVVCSAFQTVEQSTGRLLETVVPTKQGRILDHLGRNRVGPPSAVLVRRSCLDKVGLFDETLEFGEDWDLWIRLAQFFEFACVLRPLFRYRIHTMRMTTNYEGRIRGSEHLLRKHLAYFLARPLELSYLYLDIGRLHAHLGRMGRARAAFRKAVALAPLRLKSYQYLGLSLLGGRVFRPVAHYVSAGLLSSLRSLWRPSRWGTEDR
jgi:glycosyltransferase involved in cell wall biosynthesis